jgi:cytochrome c oxidase cbb3-type subunit 3
MSKNQDRLLGHAADNDGIDEYDNSLPDWWLGLFFLTIVFAFAYTADYHLLRHRSQVGEWEQEIAAAKRQWPQQDAPKALAFDEATVAAGKEVFQSTCASCHGAALEGGIGPNLKDSTWIHGNAPEQVVATIANGVAAKGMPAWGPILGPDKVSKVAAFVLSQAEGGQGGQ